MKSTGGIASQFLKLMDGRINKKHAGQTFPGSQDFVRNSSSFVELALNVEIRFGS